MDKELFTRVGNAPGPSGFEDAAQDIAVEIFKGCCDSVERDPVGNVIGFKKATNPPKGKRKPYKLMIAAHADEVGMMITHVNENGMCKFRSLGGLSSSVAMSQRVIIHGKKKLRGVIVPKFGKDEKCPRLDELLIDTGLPKSSAKQAVSPGDIVTFENDTSILNGKTWVGRNFDDRMGTYCLLQAMREVKKTSVDVYAVSSVQEEVGLRGARAAAGGICPDIGIAIDGSLTKGAYSDDSTCDLGKGTGIYMIDNLTIGHPKLVKYLFKMCKQNKIRHQLNLGGGTDAAAMQQSPGGAVVTTVGAPVRYMHSTVQLCHSDDLDATVALLVKFMETADSFMQSL